MIRTADDLWVSSGHWGGHILIFETFLRVALVIAHWRSRQWSWTSWNGAELELEWSWNALILIEMQELAKHESGSAA